MESTELQKKNDISRIYGKHDDVSSLVDTVDILLQTYNDIDIKALILSSKFDINELFSLRVPREFELTKDYVGESVSSYYLTKKSRRGSYMIDGRFVVFKHSEPNIYIVLTHEKSEFVNNALRSFLNKYYPRISATFINSYYMRDIFSKLEGYVNKEYENMELLATRFFAKSRVAHKGRKKPGSEGHWDYMDYRDAFSLAFESNTWVSSIDFIIQPKEQDYKDAFEYERYKNMRVMAKVTRNGLVQCDSQFRLIYKTIIWEIAKKASKDSAFFDNREISKEKQQKPKPFVIEYTDDVFKNKTENRRLIGALQKIENSSLSVMHPNPYLHALFVDYKDGSSYDIWVLSDSRITIVPQLRSTIASLQRLCDYIFRGFREGVVKDLSEVDNG